MSAGMMRERIKIQRAIEGGDSFGDATPEFETVDEFWARKMEKGGRQFLASDQVSTEHTVVFRIWYRNWITERHRVLWDNKQYDIVDVANPDEQERWLDLKCVNRG